MSRRGCREVTAALLAALLCMGARASAATTPTVGTLFFASADAHAAVPSTLAGLAFHTSAVVADPPEIAVPVAATIPFALRVTPLRAQLHAELIPALDSASNDRVLEGAVTRVMATPHPVGLVYDRVFAFDRSMVTFAQAQRIASSIVPTADNGIAGSPAFAGGVDMQARGLDVQMRYRRIGSTFASPAVQSYNPSGLGIAEPLVADPGFAAFGGPSAPLGLYEPNQQGMSVQIALPVRVRSSSVIGHVEAAQVRELPQPSIMYGGGLAQLQDARLGAGTSFLVRAGRRSVGIDLSGAYEHITGTTATGVPYLPSVDATSLLPSADVLRSTMNAAMNVPVNRRLSVNLGYNQQYLTGVFGSTAANVNSEKTTFLGGVSYAIPRLGSALTFAVRQFQYQDNLTPAYTFTQRRADVNLTIKF